MNETKREVTSNDLHSVINEVTVELIKEMRSEIIRRAQVRLRDKARTQTQEEKREA